MYESAFTDKLRDVLEESRKNPVSDGWRGWNTKDAKGVKNPNFNPPIEPPHGFSVSLMSDKSCPTNRSAFLELVKRQKSPMTADRVTGRLYHEIYSKITKEARAFILTRMKKPADVFNLQAYLMHKKNKIVDSVINTASKPHLLLVRNLDEVKNNISMIFAYETLLLSGYVSFNYSKFPNTTPETLAYSILPMTEYAVTAKDLFIGTRVDAFTTSGIKIVLDIKTGGFEPFHRLTTTGGALALENNDKGSTKCDIGCIMYLNFPGNQKLPNVDCDIHVISDALRREFIEERNDKIELISLEKEPICPHIKTCHHYWYCKNEVGH